MARRAAVVGAILRVQNPPQVPKVAGGTDVEKQLRSLVTSSFGAGAYLVPTQMAKHAAVVGAMLAVNHNTPGTTGSKRVRCKKQKSSYDHS
jgi:hypothetical protein